MRRSAGIRSEQTPCALVAGVAGMGLMQVLTDPLTIVAQCLHAQPTGKDDLVARFEKAQANEIDHRRRKTGSPPARGRQE